MTLKLEMASLAIAGYMAGIRMGLAICRRELQEMESHIETESDDHQFAEQVSQYALSLPELKGEFDDSK